MKNILIIMILLPLLAHSQKLIEAKNETASELKLNKDMLILSAGYGHRNFYKYSESVFVMHANNDGYIGQQLLNRDQMLEFINALKMIKGKDVGDRVVMESKNIDIEVVNPWGKRKFYQINFYFKTTGLDLSELSWEERKQFLNTSDLESVEVLGKDEKVYEKAKIVTSEKKHIFTQLSDKQLDKLINAKL